MYDPVTEKILFDAEVAVSHATSNEWMCLLLGLGALAVVLVAALMYVDRLGKRRERVFRERF